jgi:16S rRNA (guanine527-N7)-methyltransferase
VSEFGTFELIDFCTREFGQSIDPGALDAIDRFLDLLELWNERLRLTGERDRAALLRKHVVDAIACVPLMPAGGAYLDLGTGAGFPGVVVACLRPDLRTTLLDSRQRPVSFLSEAIRTLPLPSARALALRAEQAAADIAIGHQQDVVTARALRMDSFFRLAKPLLATGGRAISMQTPATDRLDAEAVAARCALRVLDVRDYRLPGGEPRRLIVAG